MKYLKSYEKIRLKRIQVDHRYKDSLDVIGCNRLKRIVLIGNLIFVYFDLTGILEPSAYNDGINYWSYDNYEEVVDPNNIYLSRNGEDGGYVFGGCVNIDDLEMELNVKKYNL